MMTPDEKWKAALQILMIWTGAGFVGWIVALLMICNRLDKIIELLTKRP